MQCSLVQFLANMWHLDLQYRHAPLWDSTGGPAAQMWWSSQSVWRTKLMLVGYWVGESTSKWNLRLALTEFNLTSIVGDGIFSVDHLLDQGYLETQKVHSPNFQSVQGLEQWRSNSKFWTPNQKVVNPQKKVWTMHKGWCILSISV